MKLEKYALIAEIVGALAIVVTLIFLIVEVRGNTDAIRAQTAQATFETSVQSFYYPEGNVALSKAEEVGLAGLTDEERAHAEALMAALINAYNNHYYQYRHGNLDAVIHEAYRARLRRLMSNQMYRDLWRGGRELYTEPFRVYVDEVIESLEE